MTNISQEKISEVAANLLAGAATRYPKNYLEKIFKAFEEEENYNSKSVMASIIENIFYGAEESSCLCTDTGIPTFHLYLNPDISIKGDVDQALIEATIKATEEVPLRKNVVEPFTYENPGNNVGWGVPFVHYHYSPQPGPMKIRVELKGFGAEGKSSFDRILTTSRNMENAVLAYVLNSVVLSKGEPCPPSFLGVGVGGYESDAAYNAKSAVFRELTTKMAPDALNEPFRQFEQRIFQCVNRLGLGPMGVGGKTNTMGVYLERRGTHTVAATVAVSHQCWASRASEVLIGENSVDYITPHLEAAEVPDLRREISRMLSQSASGGNVYELNTPLSSEDIAKLKVGDVVYLNGTICTARNGAHQRMIEDIKTGKKEEIPQEIIDNKVVFHCGPVVKKENENWVACATGPTTSSKFTDDAAFLLDQGIFNVAIGKGTMGTKAIDALRGRGVYLVATGGCAIIYKKQIMKADVKWLDLGYPEAVWIFEVNRFGPLTVSIDSKGNSLAEKVMNDVYENARTVYEDEGLNPRERYVQYPRSFAGLPLEEVIEHAKKL